MDVINKSIHALFLLALLTAFGNCFAQTSTGTPGKQRVQFYFDKPITLDSLTRYVHSHSKIRFSFNSKKVKGSQLINLQKGAYTIELLLQQIRKHTSLYYSMYNGYVIFQDNPPKPKTTPPPVTQKNTPQPPARQTAIAAHGKPTPKPTNKSNTQMPGRGIKPASAAKAPQTDPVVKKEDPATVIIPSLPAVITPADTAVANNSKTAPTKAPALTAVTPAPKKKAPATSSPAQNTSAGDDRDATGWDWQLGLQWKGTIPLYGTKNYFTGTNTRSEPYNLLIPGIWASAVNNGKHEVMLLLKPAEWYFYNNKVFSKDSGLIYKNPDTLFVRKNKRLIKTGAWYGSLQYNYHINEKWMVGAGIGLHLRTMGLANLKINQAIGDSLIADSLYCMKCDSTTNSYLSPSFLSGKVEVAYHFGAIDLGLTLLMPITSPYRNKSLIKDRPLNLQLFLRWRIRRPKDE